MPISALGEYRLRRLEAFSNNLANDVLAKEASDRARQELMARRMGIKQAYSGYRTGNKDEVFDTGTRTMAELSQYGPEGIQAANQVGQSMRTYAELNRQPAQRAAKTQWIDAVETKDPTRYPLQKKDATGSLTGILMQEVDATGNPTKNFKYNWQKLPRPSTDKTGTRQEKNKLSELERTKRGLESRILTKYNKNINLDKILTGESEIPLRPKYAKDTDFSSPTYGQMVPTPETVPDPDILKWVDTIGQLESEMGQQGKEFTPAQDVATQKRGEAKAAQPRTPKSGDIEDGYRFKGGDPSKAENWELVQ